MNGSKNISVINALMRITCGLTIVAWFTAKLVRRPWRDSYLIMIVLAAMKVAEGILRYCPMVALFEKFQVKMGTDEDEGTDMKDPIDEISPPYGIV